MGGGDVIVDGLVIEPHDERKLVESMRILAEDQQLRGKLSTKSKQKALNYTRDTVGVCRLNALLKAEEQSKSQLAKSQL